jgi:hypothetical protein
MNGRSANVPTRMLIAARGSGSGTLDPFVCDEII